MFDRAPPTRHWTTRAGDRRDMSRRATRVLPPWLVLPVGLLLIGALQACADTARMDLQRSVAARAAANETLHVRTMGADGQFSELDAATVARHLRSAMDGMSLNVLALSGGGAGGAFGAGALVGLTRGNERPDFAVVTGVSAGALIAPYAFLGPAWDSKLTESYTSGSGKNVLQFRGLGAVFGSSVYRGAPLARLIERYVDDELVRAIAAEERRGRLLLVATTDVDTGQAVVWDLGSIALYGGAEARARFRDVLVASASVPGMFPPVILQIPEHDQTEVEAHVDGGVTLPFFTAADLVGAARAPGSSRGSPGSAHIYVIVDGPLDEPVRVTPRRAGVILARSVSASLRRMMRLTLEQSAAEAQARGILLDYSAMPASYPYSNAFDFSAAAMAPLFRYSAECAHGALLWVPAEPASQVVPGSVDRLPCPAEDRSIERFAGLGRAEAENPTRRP